MYPNITALSALSFYGLAAALALRGKRPKILVAFVVCLAALMVAAPLVGTMYFGLAWPSATVGGLLFGAAIFLGCVHFLGWQR